MPDNKLVQITQMINDKNTLANDILNAAGSVGGVLKEKYLTPLNAAIAEISSNVEKNPSKEVTLINAMRSFMPEGSRHTADKVTGMLNQITCLQRLAGQLGSMANSGVAGACVHSDGVYEIDEQCVRRRSSPNLNGLLMMMLLMSGR
jgi:hypothetical protein